VNGATNVRRDPARATAGKQLILINSLATTGEMWDGVVSALDGAVEVIRFDQRDRGGPLGQTAFTIDDLIDDLFGVLDSYDIAAAHVAGVSLGGLVALAAAISRPDRVLTTTAMCCAARFRQDVWVERAAQVREQGVLPLTDAVMDRWFTRDFQERQPTALEGYRRMFASTSAAGYAFASDVLASVDLVASLPQLSVPTLVLRGEFDHANPEDDQQLIASTVRNARYEVIGGAAHLAPASHPREIASRILHQMSAV
jgi:3-oxoadipate enol-lactonase